MDDCIFCRIIAREAPAYLLHEDTRVIVFLSLENHPLVVPKAHIADIYALDDETAAAIMHVSIRMARALKSGLACDGVYLSQANGAAAGQDVFHYHLHLWPRWHGDGIRLQVPPETVTDEAMAMRHDRLRAELQTDLRG